MEKIDLHLHTNMSDGELSVVQVIEKSIESGCLKIAITDHDRIRDYSRYSLKYGIEIISGIEFSTSTKGMHILGYNLLDIDKVQGIMDEIALENQDVNYRIINDLYRDGFDISISSLLECMKDMGISFSYLDRKHIIKYLIYKGYVKNYLEAHNILFSDDYPIRKLSKDEVIKLINKHCGVSILAHPSTLYLSDYDLEKEVCELISYGLDGIEVKNRSINQDMSIRYENLAEKLGVIHTVGSDFHSSINDDIGVLVDESVFDNFKNRLILARRKNF